MRAFITIFHKGHAYDGTLHQLFRAFEIVNKVEDSEVIIMPITYQNEYVIDMDLMRHVEGSGKKIIIVDFVEYGWDAPSSDHLFGVNTYVWCNKFKNPDYMILDSFISRNRDRVAIYFKRELDPKSHSYSPYKLLPMEYPAIFSLPDQIQPVSFEEYNNRPIDVIMVWGLSNPSRPLLHGEFVKQSALNGQHLVSSLDHVTVCQKRGNKRMVVMAHIPDFARISIHILLHLQSLAKVSISLSGAGNKCFRSAESPYNSVMAIQENGLDWAYPWIDGVNSIELPNKENSTLVDENKSYQKIMDCLDRPQQLYDMYLKGTDNCKNYEASKYSIEYILKEVKNAI